MEPNFTPDHVTPKWNETRFFSLWAPDSNLGMFVHVGRRRGELDIWWTHMAVFLPDGGVAVDRQWCRNTETAGVVNNNLRWVVTEPRKRFECSFDGVCEKTTTEALAAAPRGSATPTVAISWSFEAQAHSPIWDVLSGQGDPRFAGSSHTEGSFTTSGTISIAGQTYDLSGFAFNDHSSGIRDFDTFGGDDFIIGALPDGAFHSVLVKPKDGSPGMYKGIRFRGESTDALVGCVMPELASLVMADRDFEVEITTAAGERLPVRVEVLGVLPITINDDNDNLNGLDWESPVETVLFAESMLRITMPDGQAGWGYMERSVRRQFVDRATYAFHSSQSVR